MHLSVFTLRSIAEQAFAHATQIAFPDTVTHKADGSSLTEFDQQMEKFLFGLLSDYFPGVPLLGEENHELTGEFDFGDGTYISVDPIDGTKLFAAGLSWSVSIGFVDKFRPTGGIIIQPVQRRALYALEGEGVYISDSPEIWRRHERPTYAAPMIALDLAHSIATDTEEWELNRRLITHFRYPRNEPAVAAGVELILGHTMAWVSANVKNWDVAAVAAALREFGFALTCFDGSPVPWDQVKMPRLLFAQSLDVAREVRSVALA